MNWKKWLVGLLNAVVSSAASGLPATLMGVNWHAVAGIAASSAVVSGAKWFIQHPVDEVTK